MIQFPAQPRLTVLFNRLGPYHAARLRAVAARTPVNTIEFSGHDSVYQWDDVDIAGDMPRIRLFPLSQIKDRRSVEVRRRVDAALAASRPDVVVIPGWSAAGALAALSWSVRTKTPTVLMCDSWELTKRRTWWTEYLKRPLVGLYTTSLVAGTPHAEYVASLGMSPDRIFQGYDAVDNAFFARGAVEARTRRAELRRRYNLPERYFLVVARLIPQKNLDTLFHAFADYRLRAGCDVWKLVLVGDGPLKDQLYKLRSRLAQSESIQFVGFEQYEQLPIYYGLASAFVLPSVSETWGLVVNEAMSAGLPVLVSNRCGCARDLVREGVNGFTFDPFSRAELSHCLVRASTHRRLQVFGQASQEVIRQWGPDRFASGLLNAARTALSVNPPPRQSPAQRAVLALVNRR